MFFVGLVVARGDAAFSDDLALLVLAGRPCDERGGKLELLEFLADTQQLLGISHSQFLTDSVLFRLVVRQTS